MVVPSLKVKDIVWEYTGLPVTAPRLADAVVCMLEEELDVLSLPSWSGKLEDVVVSEPCTGTTVKGELSTRPTAEEACDPAAELTIRKHLVSTVKRCKGNWKSSYLVLALLREGMALTLSQEDQPRRWIIAKARIECM